MSVLPPLSCYAGRGELWVGALVVASVPVNPQSVPVSRLWPSEVIAAPRRSSKPSPALGVTVLEATIEFSTDIVPSPTSNPPPVVLRVPPSLDATVEFTIVVLVAPEEEHAQLLPPHQLKIPPPRVAVLCEMVELSTPKCLGSLCRVRTEFCIPPESAPPLFEVLPRSASA